MTIDQIDESNIDENIKETCKAMEIQSNFCMISEKWIKVETNDVPRYREFGRLCSVTIYYYMITYIMHLLDSDLQKTRYKRKDDNFTSLFFQKNRCCNGLSLVCIKKFCSFVK